MKIQIDAVDTLFFRDGKPFAGGEDVWADTLFPPMPSVIYGALRGAYFANHIDTLDQANEVNDPTKDLTIKTIALQSNNRLLFPIPLDCVREKGNKDNREVFIIKDTGNPSISSCPVGTIRLPEKNLIVENIEDGLMNSRTLERYLQLKTDTFQCVRLSDYTVLEPKIGIGRDSQTHTSQDGMLYRIDMRRLESTMEFGKPKTQTISLFVEFEGLTLPDKGLLKLGGEGKSAYYTSTDTEVMGPSQLNGSRFKLYLASPAMFKHGWLPAWIDSDTLETTDGTLKLRLETALLGKSISIGGFDMKKNEPKIMRKAVPAGSVYYFEILEGTIQNVMDRFHHQNISDYEAQQGFGLAFIGGVA